MLSRVDLHSNVLGKEARPASRAPDLTDLLISFRSPINSPVEGKVVYPAIYEVLHIPSGCLGFLNHPQIGEI